MIEVLVTYKEDKIIEFYAQGHANSAPYGQDLVCSAVSASITGCFNALNFIDNYEYTLQEGFALLKTNGHSSYHDEVVLSTLVTILATIEATAPQFIKIDENHISENVN